MGFELRFLAEVVLPRISDGGGQTPEILAQRLYQLRLDFLQNPEVVDEETARAVQEAFLSGIEAAAPRPPAITNCAEAILWLDLAPPAPRPLVGIEPAEDVPEVSAGRKVALKEVASNLLNWEFRYIADEKL